MIDEIREAIENRRLLEFRYDGGVRVVEPHCYGITSAGNEGLRAYQVSGHSTSGKMGWKMFDLANASAITILDQNFDGPRPGYKRNDRQMKRIICQL